MRLTILAAATLTTIMMAPLMTATGAAATGAAARPGASPADFTPCRDAASGRLAGSLCATVKTPLRHDDPTLGDVDLFVRRFPAQGVSRGDVWLIAGGPGEAGAGFNALIEQFRAAFQGYDLIVPDHRGTGRSSRVCVAEEADASPGGRGLEGAEWSTCFGQLGARSPWVQSFTITNAAHDLSSLIERYSRGRETFVYGVSYGTQLVLRMMTIAPPTTVKGIVLDSLVPPDATDVWDLSHRSQGVDAVGRQVLAECDGDPTCRDRLGGSAVDALQRVIDDPRRAAAFPGGKPKAFLGALLDSPEARALIPEVIADALAGEGDAMARARARLEAFYAPFASPDAASSIPLVALISASENNARPGLTPAVIAAEETALLFTSSLPSQLIGGADITYPRDAAFGEVPSALPPVLILQGDRDPKTSHAGALAQADRLVPPANIRFVTVEGAPHFVMLTNPEQAASAIQTFTSSLKTGSY